MKDQKILCLCTAGKDRSVAVRDFLIEHFPERTSWNTWAGGIRRWANPDNSMIQKLLQADLIFAADTQHETFARGAIRAAAHLLKTARPDVQIVNLHLHDYEPGRIALPVASILRVMESRVGEKPAKEILIAESIEGSEASQKPSGKTGKRGKSAKAKK